MIPADYAFIFRNHVDTVNLIAKFHRQSTADGVVLTLDAPRRIDGPLDGIEDPGRSTIYFVEYMLSADTGVYQVLRSAQLDIAAQGSPGLPAAEFVRAHAVDGTLQGMANDLFKAAYGALK